MIKQGMIRINRPRILAWLKTINKSQAWLAREVGVTRGYVSSILANRYQAPDWLKVRLMEITHISFDDLFYITHEGEPLEKTPPQNWFTAEKVERSVLLSRIRDLEETVKKKRKNKFLELFT